MKSGTRIRIVALAFAVGLWSAAAAAQDPYMKPNNSWISISGTVDSVNPDTFMLDYGDGSVVVEMDDGDRDADAYKLLSGDKVTVTGKIDDDFFETTKIEASSVYVEKLNTSFYASPVDEEDVFVTVTTPIVVSQLTVQGLVTSVSEEEFKLNTGTRTLTVEVEEMPYNPLDEEGYQKIEVGDTVTVTGVMDADLFEGRELVARSVTEVID